MYDGYLCFQMAQGIDSLNLISKLSLSKLINVLKVFFSYYWSRVTKKPTVWGLPFSLSIEPTTACNLGCPECPSGLKSFTRPTGNLKIQNLDVYLNSIKSKLIYLNFYFQGEPYINPSFLEMVTWASKQKIYTSTSTNAHFLNEAAAKKTVESGLDRLIISIDGVTQQTYEQYRVNGHLSKVIEGTKNIIKWKKQLKSKTPYVVFQFLVVKPNEHEIDEVKKLAKSLGVNEVSLKTAQIYDFENSSPLIPTNQKYSRYKKDSQGKYQLKNKLLNQCWKMWHSAVITWDGKVVPCCFDKDAQHQMGNLNQQPFEEVWKNPLYQNFRKSLLISRKEIDICKNCSEGTEVFA